MISTIFDQLFTRSPDDPFLTLMAVAQEDSDIAALLIEILDQEPLQRRLALENWISDLQNQSAPVVFTTAVTYLLENATANRALQILSDK